MQTVKEILGTKGNAVWSIKPEASVYDAIAEMAERRVGALVVLDGDALVGIISERDYARKVVLEGRSSKHTAVREIMTPEVITARPSMAVEETMALMTEHHIRHLPVMDNDRLVGMISIGDLVKSIIDEQKFVIGQLENYITR
ncbi:MAG: CBS domain-containing protein [Thermoanaerobaculia bacterium]